MAGFSQRRFAAASTMAHRHGFYHRLYILYRRRTRRAAARITGALALHEGASQMKSRRDMARLLLHKMRFRAFTQSCQHIITMREMTTFQHGTPKTIACSADNALLILSSHRRALRAKTMRLHFKMHDDAGATRIRASRSLATKHASGASFLEFEAQARRRHTSPCSSWTRRR